MPNLWHNSIQDVNKPFVIFKTKDPTMLGLCGVLITSLTLTSSLLRIWDSKLLSETSKTLSLVMLRCCRHVSNSRKSLSFSDIHWRSLARPSYRSARKSLVLSYSRSWVLWSLETTRKKLTRWVWEKNYHHFRCITTKFNFFLNNYPYIFYSYFTEICSLESTWQQVIIGSENGLVHKVIFWKIYSHNRKAIYT